MGHYADRSGRIARHANRQCESARRPWLSRWRSGLPSVRAQERRELQDAIAMHKRREADSAKEVATLRHQARPHDQAGACTSSRGTRSAVLACRVGVAGRVL
jgi:hypothetical protein